jgi:hypothetical protein
MSDDRDFDLTDALPFDDVDTAMPTPQKPAQPGAPAVLSRAFKYIGKGLTIEEFSAYVASYNFGLIRPDYVVLHHTAIPSASWARYPSGAVWDDGETRMTSQQIFDKRTKQLNKLRDFYRDTKGWDAGPHLFIDERWIWLFTPMYDVGIHAASGNSYRDSGRRLHYSLGIEVIGYYEQVRWPETVARNVGMALAILRRRLGTFALEYRPGPRNTPQAHVGSLCSHRDFNKPACPGAAITEAFYVGVAQAAWRELTVQK